MKPAKIRKQRLPTQSAQPPSRAATQRPPRSPATALRPSTSHRQRSPTASPLFTSAAPPPEDGELKGGWEAEELPAISPELLGAVEAMQARQRLAQFAQQQRGTRPDVGERSALEAIAELKRQHAEQLEEIECRFYAQQMAASYPSALQYGASTRDEERDEDDDEVEAEREGREEEEEEEEEKEMEEAAEEAVDAVGEWEEAKSDDSAAEVKRPNRRQAAAAEDDDDVSDSDGDRGRERPLRSTSPPLSAWSDVTADAAYHQRLTPSSTSRTAHSTADTPRRSSDRPHLRHTRADAEDSLVAKEEEEEKEALYQHRSPPSPSRSSRSPTRPSYLPPRRPAPRPATAGPFQIGARDAYEKWSRPLVERPAEEDCEQFRAKELPVHILGSQYEELRRAREQRSKERKRAERRRLYDSIQPFEFAASTELRRRRKGSGEEERKERNSDADAKRRPNTDDSSSEESARGSARRHVAFGLTTAGSVAAARPSTAPVGRDGRFVAREVPYHCQVPLLDTVVKREEDRRAEVRRQRAAYLASIAALPPRMQQHLQHKQGEEQRRAAEEARKARQHRAEHRRRWEEAQRSEEEGEAPLIPDFGRLHSEFARALQARKEERPSTRPRGFRFRATEKVLRRHRGKRAQREEEAQRRERERREAEDEERQRRELRRREAAEKFARPATASDALARRPRSAESEEAEAAGGTEAGGKGEGGAEGGAGRTLECAGEDGGEDQTTGGGGAAGTEGGGGAVEGGGAADEGEGTTKAAAAARTQQAEGGEGGGGEADAGAHPQSTESSGRG